jgi:hypothetical protein
MTAGSQAARVQADYSQYWVAAGPDIDIEPGEDTIPGLLRGLGPQAVAVITGLQSGGVTVTARTAPARPVALEPGWDVVAETDLVCSEGTIAVCDWAGVGHDELGELAIAGPGRYRLRVHARHREQISERRSTEEHHLLIWPAAEPAAPSLLTPLDAYGRVFSGQETPEAPPLDPLELAAAAAVSQLATLVNQTDPPPLSGELTLVHAETIAPASPRKVWGEVSVPWLWLGNQGGGDPARFDIRLHREPWLEARGGFVADQPLTYLAFTWAWTTTRWAATDIEEPYAIRRDLITGDITTLTSPSREWQAIPSWTLPALPTTVHVYLRRHGKGTTMVELDHRDLPVELASTAQPFWQWALRELCNRLTDIPFHGYPWDR